MNLYLSPQPFDMFLDDIAASKYEDFRQLPGAAVENARAFDEMRTYLLELYGGVRVEASFVENDGQIIDCIPAELHPAARRWNDSIPTPPKPPPPPDPETYEPGPPPSVTSASREIRNVVPLPLYRNGTRDCPPGTTPLYRTTLEQLTRFRTLAAFSAKDSPSGTATGLLAAVSTGYKRYATGKQDVNCLGGASTINVWKPFALPVVQSSFVQQWYTDANANLAQTVECGWHIDANRYQGSYDPHLFIYTTRRDYQNGDSWFNEDGGVFRKVANPYVSPGAPLPFSQIDGSQIGYKMGFYLTGGNWWFYFEDQPIGYYPGAWFQNGPLTDGASVASFGGEVGSGLPSWPAMGSGRYAADGFGKAAYQSRVYLHDLNGGTSYANLSVSSDGYPCYTLEITNNSTDPNWGTYLFFGGPGGSSC